MSKRTYKFVIPVSGVILGLTIGAFLALQASDHDDQGLLDRGRARNLTDVYVYRSLSQNPSADPDDMMFQFNTHDRALPGQNYFFDSKARYELHTTRVAGVEATPSGIADVTFRFEYGKPNDDNSQPITLTIVRRLEADLVFDKDKNGDPLLTTPLSKSALNENNVLEIDLGLASGRPMRIFVGPRQDTFFFDVEQFFRIRAGLATGFRDPQDAIDFTTGYNVMSTIFEVPKRFLQTSMREDIFDVWATISVPQ